MDEIRKQFSRIAKKYDSQRQHLIPCFHDFYHVALHVIAERKEAETLLDIGAGTGLFSYFVYQMNPKLRYTLLDVSPEMLDVARQRFAGLSNFSFAESDYAARVLPGKFDLIISALSIHHLDDADKSRLYEKIYKALTPGGIFINADQVLGRTPALDEFYKTQWRLSVIESGLDQASIRAAFKRTELDKFAPLTWQLNELQRIGFREVDCIYRYHNFVVFIGIK